ncbi:hypothetical protein OIO90_001689 [Microbotryomycetes sp. JL221]|nr:hypothetical protein OIO90_001689 [Microbotryomycetes sp. JL221]
MLTKRILVLGISGIVGLSCGTNYVYSAYAPQLGSRLGLTSVQTNIVGAAGNAGVYCSGPIIGRIVDRDGPRRMLLVAAVLLFAGYFGIRSIYLGGAPQQSSSHVVALVAITELLTGIGSTAGLSSVGNTVAKSFKKTRATALSFVLSAFGLSAFFYSTIRRTLLHGTNEPTAALLLTLAVGTSISMLLGAVFVRPIIDEDPTRTRNAVATHLQDQSDQPLLAEVVEDVRTEIPEGAVSYNESTLLPPTERTPLKRAVSSGIVPISVSGTRLVRELDFWLLFSFNACTSGIGLAYINNLGSIAKTLASSHMSDSDVALAQASLVSYLSLANCLGRLTVGFLSDMSLHRLPRGLRFSRVWWNLWTACLFAVSQLVAAQAKHVYGRHGLLLPTLLTGFAHGSLFGTSGILVLERFGMQKFSSNNGVLALAPAIAGQLTNYMFGRIYDSHVPSHSSLRGFDISMIRASKLCTTGRDCYLAAFRVTVSFAPGSSSPNSMARRARTTSPTTAAAAWLSAITWLSSTVPTEAQQLPKVDFNSLGTVGVVGSFAGLSLYDTKAASVRYSSTASTLVARSPDGTLSYVGATNDGGSISAICQTPDGQVFVGGAFTSLGGQNAANIAHYDPAADRFTALGAGLEGQVRALSCNGSVVYAGGSFQGASSGTSNVAQWSINDQTWSSMPFSGLNGPVETIVSSQDGKSLFFGGVFSTSFSNSTNATLTPTGTNTSFPSLGSSLFPISLNTSDYVASPTTYTSGFGRPEYIFCPRRQDGPGASWLLVDGSVGSFIARMYRPLRVRGIRLGNTFWQGRGTRNFKFVSIPDNTVLELTYASDPADASSALATCSTDCELAHDPAVQYQDFIFPDDTVMTGFELQIFGWYGAGAGLHLMQLLSDGSYAYGVDQQNVQVCTDGLGATQASTTATSGQWNTTDLVSSIAGTTAPVRIAYVPGGTSPTDAPTLTWTPYIEQSGAYQVFLITPGCQPQGTCDQRTSVSMTATPTGQGAGEATTTTVDQTNALEESVLIYSGNLLATSSDGSSGLTVSMRLADGGASSSGTTYEMVADLITLVAASTNGTLNSTTNRIVPGYGLFEFATDGVGTFGDAVASASSMNATALLMNATGFDQLSFSMNEGANVQSMVSVGLGESSMLFIGGQFSYESGDVMSTNVLMYAGGEAIAAPNGGLNGVVTHLVELNGWIYAAGNFTATTDAQVQGLEGFARLQYSDAAATWQPAGQSSSSGLASVASLGTIRLARNNTEIVVAGSGRRGLALFDPAAASFNSTLAGLIVGNLTTIGSAVSMTNVTASTYFAGNIITISNTAAPGGAFISRTGNSGPKLSPLGFELASNGDNIMSSTDSTQEDTPVVASNVRLRRSGMSFVARSLANDFVSVLSSRSPRLEQRQTSTSSIDTSLPSALSDSTDGQVLVGAFWKNSSNDNQELLIVGGDFEAVNGQIRNLGLYNSRSRQLNGLRGVQVSGSVAVLTVEDDAVWIGGNITTDSGRQGFVIYNLADQVVDNSVPGLIGYTGRNAVVTAIAQRPSKEDETVVVGAFASAGSLPCPSVCLWKGEDRQWVQLGGGLQGIVSSMDFAGSNSQYLIVAGRFGYQGQQSFVAQWNFDNSTWSNIGEATDIPGPATAISSDNGAINKLFVAGESLADGSPYLMYWNGTTWTDINNGTLAQGSGVQQLVFVPMSTSHASNDVIESNRMLMVSGDLNINSTSVSSALYDGSAWYPYLVSTAATGSAGVVSQFFFSVTNFNLAAARHLSVGIVILISIAIALGIVFALVLIGLFIALARRREESQYPGPPAASNASNDGDSSHRNFKPATSLLATVGAATAVLLDGRNEKSVGGARNGGSNMFVGTSHGAGSDRASTHDGSEYDDDEQGEASYDSHNHPVSNSGGANFGEGEESNARARYSFSAEHPGELSVKAGEDLIILEGSDPEWFLVANNKGERGLMPSSYLA